MTFPLRIGEHTFDAAPDLARGVLSDARAGGGTIVPGARPAAWLSQAVREGTLPRDLAVGLCAALVRNGQPDGLFEAALTARQLGLTELAPLLATALGALDVGVLLTPDPGGEVTSVEDVLLRAWAALVAGDDLHARHALLVRLRQAGLRDVELAVICEHADVEDLLALLPDVLLEELGVDDVQTLARALIRGHDVALALCESANDLTASQRYAIWRAAEALDPSIGQDHAVRAAWLASETPTSETPEG